MSAFFLIISFHPIAFGQEKSNTNHKVFMNSHLGTNINDDRVQPLINKHIQGFELGIAKETLGYNEWEQLYNYPEYGVSLFYSSLGNSKVFGQELALVTFIKMDVFNWNQFSVFGRIGLGFSYLNTIADPIINPENPATSSHYNFHTNLKAGINYIISDRVELNSGVSFDHISNGNTNKPNLGLNSVSAFAGLSYLLQPKIPKKENSISPHQKHNNLFVFGGIGGKRSNYNTNYYIACSLSAELRRSLSKMFSLGIGANLYWDSSVPSSLKYLNKKSSPLDNYQTGIYISESFHFNKLTLSLQEGVYLFLYDKVDSNYFYTNANIEYNIYKNLHVRLALKAHQFHILDHPEIGLGYRF